MINERKTRERSRRIMLQGISYSLALILTYIFPLIFLVLFLSGFGLKREVTTFLAVLVPPQGFWNFLIYSLPQILKIIQNRKRRFLREIKSSDKSSAIRAAALEALQDSVLSLEGTKSPEQLFPGSECDVQHNVEKNEENEAMEGRSKTENGLKLSINSSVWSQNDSSIDRRPSFPIGLESPETLIGTDIGGPQEVANGTNGDYSRNACISSQHDSRGDLMMSITSLENSRLLADLEVNSSQTKRISSSILKNSMVLTDLETKKAGQGRHLSYRSLLSSIGSARSFQTKCASTSIAAAIAFKDATCDEVYDYIVEEDVNSVKSCQYEDYFRR